MSSRVLKKLQGDKELELTEKNTVEDDDDGSDAEDDSVDPNALKKKQLNLNRYDLLNQQSPSESEVKEDDNETEHASTAANLPSGSISKKKKKKRKKKSTKHSGHHISSEDNDLNDKYLSEIDSFIEKTSRSPRITGPVQTCKNYRALLSVEYKNLNTQNEMRRTFGKRVVKMENKRVRTKLSLKSQYIVNYRDSWPPVSKDIITSKPCSAPESGAGVASTSTSDAVVCSDSNITWFAFQHSNFYQTCQYMFLSAVESTDSDFMVKIIKRCPYHVDSLIQLSELCKMTENYSMASELIERAVLVLESSLHNTFSLISGNCRLDYRRQENRSFFIVLFKHAQYTEAKACCRTAFELSKLILSLNPDEDPVAMILIIDYYAIRSKQYAWLVKFYEEWEKIKNLSQLPNMAYSYALALFNLHGDSEEADTSLQYALLMFPGLLRPLLDALSVQTDQRVLAHNYFNSEVSGSQSPSLHQLIALYICRAKIIWRDENVLSWLEKNVNITLDRIDAKEEIINDYALKRKQRYVNPPRAILRHVILSDYKEKVPLAAFFSAEKEAILMYDPLPPLDSINFYDKNHSSSSSSPTTSNSRPLSMFFQSMMPSFNMQQEVDRQHNHDDDDRRLQEALNDAEGAAGTTAEMQSYSELRHSLTRIVEAMRDFLSNLGISQQNAGGNTGSESSEEDSTDYGD